MNKFEVVDILLVEDSPFDAELTIRAIQGHNLVNPFYVVEDGAEALDFIFCRGAYAGREFIRSLKVILLDLKLPKMSGLEVLKVIKSDERTRDIPVVILTSSQEDPDIKTAYALGANSYVVKPVDFHTFEEVVSKLGYYWLLVNQPPK
jgi:two-component system, response regulator